MSLSAVLEPVIRTFVKPVLAFAMVTVRTKWLPMACPLLLACPCSRVAWSDSSWLEGLCKSPLHAPSFSAAILGEPSQLTASLLPFERLPLLVMFPPHIFRAHCAMRLKGSISSLEYLFASWPYRSSSCPSSWRCVVCPSPSPPCSLRAGGAARFPSTDSPPTV